MSNQDIDYNQLPDDNYDNYDIQHKSDLQIYLMVINACNGALLFGFMLQQYTYLQSAMEKVYNIDSDGSNLITCMYFYGAFLGCLLLSVFTQLLNKIGFRKFMMIADIIAIVGLLLSLIANVGTIAVSRLIVGFSVGLNTTLINSYSNQVSPQKISGKTGTLFQTFINVGLIISVILGIFVPDEDCIKYKDSNCFDKSTIDWYYRFIFLFPIIFPIIRFALLLTKYRFDPAQQLVEQGRDEEAKTVLKLIYEKESAMIIFKQLKKKQEQQGESVNISDLFLKPFYQKRMFIAFALCFFQQLSGINGILAYSSQIFDSIFNDHTTDVIASGILNILLTFSAYVSGLIIDTRGRKIVLFFGEILCALFLGLAALFAWGEYNKYVSALLILLYCFSFGTSLGPVVWMYMPEMVPVRAVSLASCFNWLCAALLTQFFQKINDGIHIYGCFLLFCIVCIVGAIFMQLFVIETKGRSSQEIEYEYTKHLKNRKEGLLDDQTRTA